MSVQQLCTCTDTAQAATFLPRLLHTQVAARMTDGLKAQPLPQKNKETRKHHTALEELGSTLHI